jgi:preprotein translocase SecE subunit
MILLFKESIEELKKLHTPSKKETYVTTIAILVTIIIFSLMTLLTDFLIAKIIRIVFGL